MKLLRKVGKWALIIYVAQALVGIGVGVYFGLTMNPAEIERLVNCVTH